MADEPSKHDIKVMMAIADKYGLTSAKDAATLMIVMMGVQSMGLGRNQRTANILKALAEIVECPILSYTEEAHISKG